MMARTPSTFRLIGAGVTSVGALAAIFGAGGSNAQTLANLETDRSAYLQSQCGHIGDGAERVGCMAAKSIEFSRALSAIMKDRAAAARQEAAEHRRVREAIEKQSAVATAEHQKVIAGHQKAGEAARTSAQCLSDLSAALTANPPRITVAEARVAKTTPTPSDDPCVWRSRLQPRLGELTKR